MNLMIEKIFRRLFLCNFALIVAFCFVLISQKVSAVDLTAESLFNIMEERTDKIYSLVAQLELSSGKLASRVVLSIQSPDKFAMDFENNAIRVVFDGERLWIYVLTLSEVFTLDTSSGGGWISDALREWVNPKQIVTKVTRKTLFSFFDVEMLPQYLASSTKVSETEPIATYTLRFTPIGGNFFKKLFHAGYYEMVFSTSNFLPVTVREYSPEGLLSGTLSVINYRINENLPKERFVFEVPPNVKQVPISEVIAQKIEQSKDMLIEQIDRLIDRLKKKLIDWGI